VPTVPAAPEFSEAPSALATAATQSVVDAEVKPQVEPQQQAPEITEAEFEKLISELIKAQEEKMAHNTK